MAHMNSDEEIVLERQSPQNNRGEVSKRILLSSREEFIEKASRPKTSG